MNVTLYKTSDDMRKVNKTLTTIGTQKTLTIYDSIDIISPVFVLDYNADLLTANYLYCGNLARYYFINNITLDSGKRMYISCSEDVLMTFRTQLLKCECCVMRNENALGEVVDDKLPIAPNRVAIEGEVLTCNTLTTPTPTTVLGVMS